jgi:hypothetical protein
MRYRPDHVRLSHQLGSNHGPLIIGQQETGLERTLAGLDVNSYGGIYHEQLLGHPFVSRLGYSNLNDRSPSYQGEYPPDQLPSSAELYTPAFTPRSSAPSPPWSPSYSPYSTYGFQPTAWAAYYPGAIGQERGVPVLPQARGSHSLQQHRHPGKSVARQGHEYGSAHHNVVDVERIRQGTDVRTTVRLHIP